MLVSDGAARTLVDIIARVVAIRKERLSIIICQMPSRQVQVAGMSALTTSAPVNASLPFGGNMVDMLVFFSWRQTATNRADLSKPSG